MSGVFNGVNCCIEYCSTNQQLISESEKKIRCIPVNLLTRTTCEKHRPQWKFQQLRLFLALQFTGTAVNPADACPPPIKKELAYLTTESGTIRVSLSDWRIQSIDSKTRQAWRQIDCTVNITQTDCNEHNIIVRSNALSYFSILAGKNQ